MSPQDLNVQVVLSESEITAALHRDVAGLRMALRDKEAANSALTRENERLSKALRLCQREADMHHLRIQAVTQDVLRNGRHE